MESGARQNQFQSTHSLRSATNAGAPLRKRVWVSIHALLAECDRIRRPASRLYSSFNPRTPCGVRPRGSLGMRCPRLFQSTHSLRSATTSLVPSATVPGVSIHALLAECDSLAGGVVKSQKSFNPRTPCGVRQADKLFILSVYRVSIHALLAECDTEI